MSPPTVSVIIIFLNAEKFLRDAIDSVLAQTFTDWELFLVDDGSTDDGTRISRSFAAQHPGRIHYLEHEGHVNKGMSASRNLGLAHANREFVALLDSDDIWFPEKLEKQLASMAAHPEVALIAAPAMNWYADGAMVLQPMTLSPGVLQPGGWIPKILESDDNTSGPSSVLIRTRALKEVGGFESSFKGPLMVFEDQVTWFKISLAAPIYFDPEPVTYYRIHADSCCVSTPADHQLSARIVLYARLTEMIQQTAGPARKRRVLLALTRARVGELVLESDRWHQDRARSLDATGAVARQTLGLLLGAVRLLGAMFKRTASGIFRMTFAFLTVVYYEGPLSGARTLPGVARTAARKLVARSLHAAGTSR